MHKTLLVLFAAAVAWPAPAHALDLRQALQLARQHDATYSSARAGAQALGERPAQGLAGLLPSASLNSSLTHGHANSEVLGLPTRRDAGARGYSVSLSQPLFRPASWERYQQGKLSGSIGEAQLAQAEQDLMLRTAQAYFEVLAAQDTLATATSQKAAIGEQLAAAKKQFEIGTAAITDTHEAQARYDMALAQEHAARNALAVQRSAFEQVVGPVPPVVSPLRANAPLLPPHPDDVAVWTERAAQAHPAVVARGLELDVARHEIRRQRAGHYPSVDLVASHGYTNQRESSSAFGGNRSDTSTIGVSVSVPLFAGFAVDAQVREALRLEEKARADLDAARRSWAQAARQAFLGVQSGLAQVKALEAAEQSSQMALEANRVGYQVGTRMNTDVLNAQQLLYSARRDLARARYDTIIASLRLKAATGDLSDADIGVVNALLD